MKILFILFGIAASSPVVKQEQDSPWSFDRNQSGRIVGGGEAEPNSIPWIVDIRQGNRHLCGGSIINSEWIITAAQCSHFPVNTYEIVIGYQNPNDPRPQVDGIIRHENYNPQNNYQNDIALMHVHPPFNWSEAVKSVELPSPSFQPAPIVTVAGWGSLEEGAGFSNKLHRIDIVPIPDAYCNAAYNAIGQVVTPAMLCAGNGTKDACLGDSGGPLTSISTGVTTLAGIVSWGRGCGRSGFPGVYTEVSYFKNWIDEKIREDNSSFIEQTDGCGGSLEGSSGRVSYRLEMEFGANEKCTWLLRVNASGIRIEVITFGNTLDALYLTELDNESGKLGNKILIDKAKDYFVSGPIVFLTLESDEDFSANEGFDIHFYGVGSPQATGKELSNYFVTTEGTFRYPINDTENYRSNELVAVVINPQNGLTHSLVITGFTIEDGGSNCSYDWLNVHTLNEGEFGLGGTYCGTASSEIHYSSGPFILILMTDSSTEASGFIVAWT